MNSVAATSVLVVRSRPKSLVLETLVSHQGKMSGEQLLYSPAAKV